MNSEDIDITLLEEFLYQDYMKSYKKHMVKSIDPNGDVRFIDRLKMQYLSSILPINLDKVYIQSSKIHGSGVFAKRDIQKDELITFYPGDIVEYTPDKNRHLNNHVVLNNHSDRFKKIFGPRESISNSNDNYSLKVDDFYTIIGEPKFKNNMSYVGHIINDGAKCPNGHKNEKVGEVYTKVSLIKSNCRYYSLKGGLHMAMIATRDIKKDQELLAMYGIQYWNCINNN